MIRRTAITLTTQVSTALTCANNTLPCKYDNEIIRLSECHCYFDEQLAAYISFNDLENNYGTVTSINEVRIAKRKFFKTVLENLLVIVELEPERTLHLIGVLKTVGQAEK